MSLFVSKFLVPPGVTVDVLPLTLACSGQTRLSIKGLNSLAVHHGAFPFSAKNPGTIVEAVACVHTAVALFPK